jgi:hypothetical protein
MPRISRLFAFGLAVMFSSVQAPANAARPLLDYHRLDAYFALYAADSSVPWRDASVRIDTYTSAPIEFSAYQADVADVIRAGENTQARAVDTRRLRRLAHWTYAPPGGYRFQTNDVTVPLGTREGFFVVEARRGSVGEQVWINRTRIGLLSKESPENLVVYAADLSTGRPLARMRISFIVGKRFVDRYTDADGIVDWDRGQRPVFALAQWGSSSAFLSFLPQPPLPHTIVAVKSDSAVVHAGDDVHLVGFARTRAGTRLRAAGGTAFVAMRSPHGATAQTSVHLDSAGAFSASLHVPQSAAAGDYVVAASINGATSATQVHVDANSGGLSLSLAPQCEGTCDPDADVPVVVQATRNGAPDSGVRIEAQVIRSPHAYAGEAPQSPWGIAEWFSSAVVTGTQGRATIFIPHATDGLPSTYGVRVSSGGATADTRIAVPNGKTALRLVLEHDDIGSGTPAKFDVYASEFTSGKPVSAGTVRVQLIHGSSVQQQDVALDEHGHGHGSFSAPQTGSNLVLASLGSGQAADAAQLQVEPQTMQSTQAQNRNIVLSLDRPRYAAGDDVRVEASLAGASGSALFTVESAGRIETRVVPLSGDGASARFRAEGSAGELAAGAAFVRDGALQWDTTPLIVDAPGRPLAAQLILDRSSYTPGSFASLRLGDVRPGTGTLVVRLTKGAPTGSASFGSAPAMLAVGTTATQDSASGGGSWHPWVDSTGDHPVIQTFVRRSAPPEDLTLMQADTASVFWKIDRHAAGAIEIQVPEAAGKYVVSLLKIDDDGRVTASSGDLVVAQ